MYIPKGIFSLSCSRLKFWSTIHLVTFSDSSGRGITTFCCEDLICVVCVGWGAGAASTNSNCECFNHKTTLHILYTSLCHVLSRSPLHYYIQVKISAKQKQVLLVNRNTVVYGLNMQWIILKHKQIYEVFPFLQIEIPCSICWASTSSAGFKMSTIFILGLTPGIKWGNLFQIQFLYFLFITSTDIFHTKKKCKVLLLSILRLTWLRFYFQVDLHHSFSLYTLIY